MNDFLASVFGGLIILVIVIGVIVGAMYGFPKWGAWRAEISGEAKLREAYSSRQIKVEEAKADLEAASLYAEAEVERAKGVAKANAIIGDSLKGNEAYLRYLWIQGLHDGSSETVYIPTEAGLPILEAGRRLAPALAPPAD